MTQDWTNIIFGYDVGIIRPKGYNKAKCAVLKLLHEKGLTMEYECNGDGDNEVLMSFRVVGL